MKRRNLDDCTPHCRDAAYLDDRLERELQLREEECDMFEDWVDAACEIGGAE